MKLFVHVKNAPLPPNEDERLDALARYQILDTSAEANFDELAMLASQVCGTAMALISFVDRDRLWFKSRHGWEITESSRDLLPCPHAVLQENLLEIPDTLLDERFAENPYVNDSPGLRFYAGMPLVTSDRFVLGTLCVLHRQPHQLSESQRQSLAVLARQVMTQLELRRHLNQLARSLEEQKVMEQRLKDSESFFQALVESLPQNIIRKDGQGRFIFANQKFCQSIGRSMEELLGRTDFDLFPTELAGKYHRDDLRVMATRENLDTVEAYQTPLGDKLFVHVIKTPLYDAQGQVVGIQGIFWDVTQRKRIEEALAYERDLLRALLDNIPDRIYFKDVHSRFLRCSSSMAKRLGLTSAREVVGKTDFDFHPRELAQEFFNDEQRIILTGQPMINKLEKQFDPQGEEIWASVTKVPIYNQNGAVTGIIGISRDVTQLKKAELELEQARDAALESVRIKSQFLANMSHEIRTPMNAITGMTGLLRDTLLDHEQREFVDTIGNSTATLLAIINEILDFSKLEAGKIELEEINFDLRHLVESTANMMADAAQRKGLELACFVHSDVPNRLQGDPGRLRQILTNLLSNAVKFTDHGEVLLEVVKVKESSARATVRFAVSDTGIGMDASVLPQIFDAFTQADGSTTRKYGGTGLGLTISKQLVQLMGGRLEVQSTKGKGSKFFFHLGLAKQPSPADISPARWQGELSEKCALVVDDSNTNRQILHDQLSSLGMQVVTAESFVMATQLICQAGRNESTFDVVLVDLVQPGGNAIHFLENLQATGVPMPPLVALTPYHCGFSAQQLLERGFAGRLIKPVRLSRLKECLYQIVTAGRDNSLNDPEHPGSPAPIPAMTPPTNVSAGQKARILLAEDNKVNQRVAISQLKKLGYSADAVGNGREVLQIMKDHDYDIILMDCQMPEMDGYEVTKRIRALNQPKGQNRHPYIIALTANSLHGDRERCLDAGMNDYLTKPIDIKSLEEVLQRALPQAPAKDHASAESPQNVSPKNQSRSLPETAELPRLDVTVLAGLKGLRVPGQPDPLAELVDLFRRDSAARLESMTTALRQGKRSELGATAHSMKGSSNNLGARRLGELCRQLESQCKEGHLESSPQLIEAIKEEYHLVEQALQMEVQP